AGAVDGGAVTAAWEAALRAPEWERAPVWIHGDLDLRNLLVEEGRLSAVVDFRCAGVGGPARGGAVLSQALIALPYYTMETNPGLVLEARRWLAEVLADHTSMPR